MSTKKRIADDVETHSGYSNQLMTGTVSQKTGARHDAGALQWRKRTVARSRLYDVLRRKALLTLTIRLEYILYSKGNACHQKAVINNDVRKIY